MGDPSNPILKDSGLKYHANKSESIEPDDFVIDETTEKLRLIVENYAGTNWIQLFVSKSENSDEVLSLMRIQKDTIPAELVGEWASNQSKFKGGILSAGVAIYINTFGIAGIVEAPEANLPPYDIGNKLDATYNITNHVLTLTKEPDSNEGLTNSITDTFIYDPQSKTLSPKNAIIKDVLKRHKDQVPYGVIENLD